MRDHWRVRYCTTAPSWTLGLLPLAGCLWYSALEPSPKLLLFGLAATSALLAWAWARPCRLAVTLDAGGLTDWRLFRRPRRVRWESIVDVAAEPDSVLVRTTDGPLRFGNGLEWRALGHTVAAVLAERAEAQAGPADVTETQWSAWLGLTPGEVRVCPCHGLGLYPLPYLATLAAAAATACYTTDLFSMHQQWDGVLLVNVMPFTLTALALGRRLIRDIRFSHAGIEVRWHNGRRRRYPWSSVHSVDQRPGGWVIVTSRGDIPLPAGLVNPDKLLLAVGNVIEARHLGAVLTRLDELPARALSRAHGDKPGAERGISRLST